MATKGKINVDYSLRYSEATGSNRYMANAQRYSTIAYRDVLQYAAKAAHVPESSIDVAMDALYDALAYFVLNGHNIKIDGIGTFNIGVNAYAMTDEADAGADAVHRLRIGFIPEMSLRQAMNNVAVTVSVSNPNGLGEDMSVPAKIVKSYYGTNPANFSYNQKDGIIRALSLTDSYLGFNGERMSRDLTYTVQAVYKSGSTYQSVNLTANIVTKNAKWQVAKLLGIPEGAEAAWLLSVVVNDGANQIFNMSFSMPSEVTGDFVVSQVKSAQVQYGGRVKGLSTSIVNAIPSTSYNEVWIEGVNLDRVTPSVTGATATIDFSSANYKKIVLSDITTSVVITCGNVTYQLAYPSNGGGGSSSSSSPVVTSLSANGVSINNGGSSTITAGSSYNFTLAGANLSGLTAANIIVPAGSTISNFAASANQVSFTLGNAAAGTIAVSYGGSTLFSVTVTEYTGGGEGEATVTSIAGIANNGSYSVDGMNVLTDHTFEIVGTGLNNLAASDFKHMRGSSQITDTTFSLNEGSATARTLTWHASFENNDKLIVQKDGTTLFTLNITGGMVAEY